MSPPVISVYRRRALGTKVWIMNTSRRSTDTTATDNDEEACSTEPSANATEPPTPSTPSSVLRAVHTRLPGIALVLPIAVVATGIGILAPIIGGPVSGIVLGVAVSAVRRPRPALNPGISWCAKFVLQLAVVLFGAQLSLRQVFEVGLDSLPVMLGTLVVCLALAWWVGRKLLRVHGDLATLIGAGTGVCGASAIAAVTPVIGAVGADVTYAISTIFLFNIAAVVVFPFLGHLLGMGQQAFGLFAGTAVNDTSSVVAAAATYGDAAANHAVVVKLTRTLMIIPITVGLSLLVARRTAKPTGSADDPAEQGAAPARNRGGRLFRLVPWFLIGFLLLAAVNSLGVFPQPVHAAVPNVAGFLITMALTGIGLTTDLPALRRAGARPLLLGGILWVAVTVTSIGLQAATGTV